MVTVITSASVSSPESMPHAAPAPRWAQWAAHLAALTPLPSGLWRLAMVLGHPAGYTPEGYAGMVAPPWGIPWLLTLSVLTEAAALLTLGLVRPWGEVAPRWIPFIGGRRIPTAAAVVPAAAGSAILLVLWTPFLFWWTFPDATMTPAGHTVIGFIYLPLVAWGPLLAAVTVSYYRRRSLSAPPGS